MDTVIAALTSAVEIGGTAIVALIVVIAILRGSRNKYVGSSTYVLDAFSLHPAAVGEEPFIRISGRHQGFISWLMALLGLEARIDINVGAREWSLRSGSFAGMHTTTVPLGHVTETICGYQRSLLALFVTIFFALNCLWSALRSIGLFLVFASAQSESSREQAAAALSTALGILIAWMAFAIVAGSIYYFSKRIAFAVGHERISGFVFKRSFIGNHVVDLAQMEEATFLLNRLVRAAYYEEPGVNIPQFTPSEPAERPPLLRWWMLLSGCAVLALFAILLGDYGAGVNLAIHTTPPDTAVWLDNGFAGQTDPSGALLLMHVTRQPHFLRYSALGYQVFAQPVSPGTFESEHPVNAQLALMRYPMKLNTVPGGVSITLDGQTVGSSNASGYLLISSVERGKHVLSASLPGYRTVEAHVEVLNAQNWQVALVSEAEAARQEAASRQAAMDAHLNRSRALFRAGQYQEAVTECDAVLKTDPTNQAALALKKQIAQTRGILGQ